MELDQIYKKLGIKELNLMQKNMLNTTEHLQDVVLLSPTGSGKTLAFLLPVLRNIDPNIKEIQSLVIVPARELALQIESVFKKMGTRHKVSVAYGGHDKRTEINNFIESPAVLIGTAGRIAYHLHQKNIDPSHINTLILDEFDKALELGFQEDMEYIISCIPEKSQRILTSATPMIEIPNFTGLKNVKIIDFLKTKVDLPAITIKKVITTSEEKLNTLFHLICKIGAKRILVFCNHREAVDRISDLLKEKNIDRETFHGGMEQDERERALLKFRNNSVQILITTDLASRGLDVPEIDSIIHYQLPPKEDAYIHRNGRTARMKAEGNAYLIMTNEETCAFIKNNVPVEEVTDFSTVPPPSFYQTLYISVGKKDKVNKVDVVGFLIKKGQLNKEEIGIIEVKDTACYVAIARDKINFVIRTLSKEKLKNKKVKMEIAL